MYTDWFKLKRLPFRLRPDPDFLYLECDMGQVLESLRAAIATGHGVACLIGESGVGKTTLLHTLAQQFQASMSVARVQQPGLTPEELMVSLAEQFQLAPKETNNASAASRLARFIAEEGDQGRLVLMLVDEAHRFPAATLRELVNLAARQPAPFIVLAGEPVLLTALSGLEAHGVTVHPVVALRLHPLTEAQISGYVAYRLNVAGGAGRALFDPEATIEILRYTGGTPQLINVLCDSALALAETHSSQRVGPGEIRDAVQELKWVEFSARTPARDPAESGTRPAAVPGRALVMEIEIRLGRRFVERVTLKPGRRCPHSPQQQVRQPPALPDHHHRRAELCRGPGQHQWHRHQWQAPPAPSARAAGSDRDRQLHVDLPGIAHRGQLTRARAGAGPLAAGLKF
jgi:type II secretory pathway predicted ATPase ExeA